jgi:hypothetical protein
MGLLDFSANPVLAARGTTDRLYYQINRCPNTRTDQPGRERIIFLLRCCGPIARVEVVGGTLLDRPQGTAYVPRASTHRT